MNRERWGGGVALLVSGPGANRLIAEQATAEQLELFGLTEPQMTLGLTLIDGELVEVIVGDATPDRRSYYIKETTDSRRLHRRLHLVRCAGGGWCSIRPTRRRTRSR